MKQISVVAVLMILAGVLSVRLFGHPNKSETIPAAKIAFIDPGDFADDKLGIKRYVAAIKALDQEFKGKTSDADKAAYKKRFFDTMDPIQKDLAKALDQFATERGITLTLDISRMPPGTIVTADPSVDITRSFIADYNSKHPLTP